QVVRSFGVTSLPVRAARFVARKNWIVAGSDDFYLRLYNYNTHERVSEWEAHNDYIRGIAVHPVRPLLLSCSDDLLVKMWDWESNWSCVRTFEGHVHYVMAVAFNPKDSNCFATASLDRTVKVWNINSSSPSYTLDGHEKGVCTVDFYPFADKPYIVSGGDDALVKVWDYQNKSCVQTLSGHTNNVAAVGFHGVLPLIISCSEDDSIRIWNANHFKPEQSLSYSMGRVWGMSALKGSGLVGFGSDQGSLVLQLGRDVPLITMDTTGKVIWARNTDIKTTNLSALTPDVLVDGQKIAFPVKDFGQSEVLPSSLSYSPSGRFVAVLGDGEYVIYTAVAWRNKAFGPCTSFAWSADSNQYPQLIYWSESGKHVAISTQKEGFYILDLNPDAVGAYLEQNIPIPSEGIEEAFSVVAESQERSYTLAHLPCPLVLLKYLSKFERIFLANKDCSIFSYHLSLAVLEVQMLVLHGELDRARGLLGSVPSSYRDSLALFLEANGLVDEALDLAADPNVRFKLALLLGRMDVAIGIADSAKGSKSLWEAIADSALSNWNADLALTALEKCTAYEDLSLMRLCLGLSPIVGSEMEKRNAGFSFFMKFVAGDRHGAFDLLMQAGRYSEAGLFARTWLDRQSVIAALERWREQVQSSKESWNDFSRFLLCPENSRDELGHTRMSPVSVGGDDDDVFAGVVDMNGLSQTKEPMGDGRDAFEGIETFSSYDDLEESVLLSPKSSLLDVEGVVDSSFGDDSESDRFDLGACARDEENAFRTDDATENGEEEWTLGRDENIDAGDLWPASVPFQKRVWLRCNGCRICWTVLLEAILGVLAKDLTETCFQNPVSM
ncbi:unnamed protein product, partial [Sphagnum compactum]